MIVDDEPSSIDILYEILKDQYAVVGSVSVDDAQKLLATQELPELILLDVNMPVMNGYDFCKEIKSNPDTADVPVIFITAKKTKEDQVHGFDAGAADYIVKPFYSAVAKARIKTHVTLKRKNEELKDKISELEKSLRVFENKVTRPAVIKHMKSQPDNKHESNINYASIFLDDHALDLCELEDIIDSRVSLMYMKNEILSSQLNETSTAIGRYGDILSHYPDFITLGGGLKEFASELQRVDTCVKPKSLKMALECLETLSFTLLHWRKQLFSGTLNDPNAYDKSLLADIKIILKTLHGTDDTEDDGDDGDDLELF